MNNLEIGKKRSNNIVQFVEAYDSLTINQCADLFYPNAKTAYKIAQRKLSKLVNDHYFKVCQNEGNENVYYINKKLSRHDLLINDFFIFLVKAGATNINFEKPRYWLNGKLRSDAFFSYDYGNYTYFNVLEVCLTHKDIPLKSYETLYKSGEAHTLCCGTFPRIVVMDDTQHNQNFYHSDLFQVIQIDLALQNFPLIFVD